MRTHRNLDTLISRVEEGDLAVIDRRDLDASVARALLARKPAAVLNAAEFISGRYANLGPRMLVSGGVTLLEGSRDQVLGLRDGQRLHRDGTSLLDGAVHAVDVREVTAEDIEQRMDAARVGLASQLDTFAHTASEFLRREEGLLLHGTGAPDLRADLDGRVVVVVGPAATAAELKRLRAFLREQRPALIAVDSGAELLRARRLRPDVLVLTGDGAIDDKALSRCREVVLNGSGDAVRRRLEKLNLPTHTMQTSAAGSDVGLLLAGLGGARLVVPVGTPATLEDFIDRNRSDQASAVLARLRLGSRLVEAAAVPLLYTGSVRRWHLLVVLLAAAAVLAYATAVTPIGNEWWHDLHRHLPGVLGG
ncbi:MAG: putative cytokinetic ring protein SteA [Marmoricola sp.]